MTTVNPILPITALLRPQSPGVYPRAWIYDPTWSDPSYSAYLGQKIVPAVASIVQDSDGTPLWVKAVDPVTFIPTYIAVPLSTSNDNVVSLINFGSSMFRLYADYRNAPYPVTPDSKLVFIGKSPRFYTLVRYPDTARETIVSQYFDSTGGLTSQMVPMKALDSNENSWYLPRCHINVLLEENEEIRVRVYNEDGSEVYNAMLHAKTSAVINEDVVYAPSIVAMTISGNQQLADGTFFLQETQDFGSLGLRATLIYDDGSTQEAQVDGTKCVMYGHTDFISSFSGLKQYVTIKYFRSENEAISPQIADATGQMISIRVPVTVIANTLGTTTKIMPMPVYNTNTARYVMRYFMYYGDGRTATDVTPYASIVSGTLVTDSSYFGVSQTYTVGVDMKNVDPTNYPVSALFQQTVVIQFGPPTQLVKWTIRDATTSPFIYGQNTSAAQRPVLRYDRTRKQYFLASYIYSNVQAFLNSFYFMAAPPFDPQIATVPQTPTHFAIRDLITGNMIVTAPVPVGSFNQPFTILGDNGTGLYLNSTVIVEFYNVINAQTRRVLFGVPVDVAVGSYVTG